MPQRTHFGVSQHVGKYTDLLSVGVSGNSRRMKQRTTRRWVSYRLEGARGEALEKTECC